MKLLTITVLAFVLAAPVAHAQSGLIGTQCKADIDRYCDDFEHLRGGVRLCLEQHAALVTGDCRTALENAGPQPGRYGWGAAGQGQAALGLRQMISLVENMGYTDIREIEIDGSHYEIEATDPEGNRSEIYVDAFTGKILRKGPAD